MMRQKYGKLLLIPVLVTFSRQNLFLQPDGIFLDLQVR